MFDIIDRGYRNIDRSSPEYLELIEQRYLYKLYGSDYKEMKWATEVLDRLEKKSVHDYYTDQDREEFYKACNIIDEVNFKLKGDSRKEERTPTHYIWSTAGDDKVRPSHAANDGETFAWDNPPSTGHPGDDYGCRCIATDILPEEEEKPTPPIPQRKPERYDRPTSEEVANRVREDNSTPSVPKKPKEMRTSPKGVQLIIGEEGYKDKPYRVRDNRGRESGNPTIGYGHDIRPGEKVPDRITSDEAEAILDKDLKEAEKAVRNRVKVPLTQPQYDALVIYTYNVGSGGLRDSDVLEHVNNEDHEAAARAFSKPRHSDDADGNPEIKPGSITRGKREEELYRNGTYK